MDKWEKIIVFDRLLNNSRYCVPLFKALDALDCSEATFHRIRGYMQSVLGAPLVFDRRYKGYKYDTRDGKTFELPGFWLTRGELEALLSFDHAVESIQGGYFRDILGPVRKRFEPMLAAQKTSLASLNDRVKILPLQSRNINQDIFRTVSEAVVQRKRLYLEHSRLDNMAPVGRTISPQTLVHYRDNWYVDGFCHLRNELRTFALNRISKASIAPGKPKHVPRKDLDDFFASAYGIFTGKATKTAELLFTGIPAREVSSETWHPKQTGTWQDNGTYRLVVPYGNPRELIMDILRWGDGVEVTGPKELRDLMRSIIARIQKKYEN